MRAGLRGAAGLSSSAPDSGYRRDSTRGSDLEPEARRFVSQDRPARRLRPTRATHLVAVAAEPGHLRGVGRRCPRQFCPLLVEAPERGLLESDLALELEASIPAAPPAQVFELALGGGESFGCS